MVNTLSNGWCELQQKDGLKVTVHVENIEAIEPMVGGTIITLTSGKSYTLGEDYAVTRDEISAIPR